MATIKGTLETVMRAEDRARNYLVSEPSADLFLGLTGVKVPEAALDLHWATIGTTAVPSPPGVIHICRAAKLDRLDYLGVASTCQSFRGELWFKQDERLETSPLDMAWHFVALVKLRNVNLRCPAAASRSWNVIPALDDNSVAFWLLDLVRGVYLRHSPPEITVEDLRWAANNYMTALELRDHSRSRRFGLAFNIAYTWNLITDPRTCLGNLWTGLEALFGDRTDMRRNKSDSRTYSDKIADRIADWMGDSDRNRIRTLYDRRSDVLHGRWLDETDLGHGLVQTEELLRRSLILAIERGQQTLPDWS